MLPPESLTVSDARGLCVVPSEPGAFELDGKPAGDTLRTHGDAFFPIPWTESKADLGEPVYVYEEEVVWGGFLFSHYGHFLCEAVARLWPMLPGGELDGLPVIFTAGKRHQFMLDWLDAFGVRVVALPDHGPSRLTRARVPEPAWRWNAWVAPEMRSIHLHARSSLEVPVLPRHDVLWVSRPTQGRRAHDEALLQWLLGDRITPFLPETMPLAEQIAMFESARAVAGVVGSAFHTLLLTEDPPDALYLCPPWDKPPFGAQHRLTETNACFAPVLTNEAWILHGSPRKRVVFPHGYRLLVPEALRALDASVLPGLLDDGRLASFACLERHAAVGSDRDELDAAVRQVLHEPHSIECRRRLGRLFEEAEIADCAREQLAAANDLERRPGEMTTVAVAASTADITAVD